MSVSRFDSLGSTITERFLFSAVCWLMLTAAALGAEALPGWGHPVDPDGDCSFDFDGGSLTVVAPGPTHSLSAELNRMNAPRVLRPIDGDFVVDLQVNTEFTPGEQTIAQRTAYQGSGLILMKDDQTYVRLESAVLVRGGRPRFYANFELRVDGSLQRFGTPVDFALNGQGPVWLRLERRGDQILGAVTQEPGKWTYLQSKTTPLPAELQLGVAAINASSKSLVAKFSDLRVFTPHVDPPPAPLAAPVGPAPVASDVSVLPTIEPAVVETIAVEAIAVESATYPSCCRPSCPPRYSRCLFRRRR